MRSILIYIIVIFLSSELLAQQEQQYSQYFINPFTINPAVSSTEDFMDMQMGFRGQWQGLEGSPKTAYLTAFRTFGKPFYHMHYRGEHKNWHGAGLHVFNDRTGPIKRNSMLMAYSYNMSLFKKTRLSLGTSLGLKQLKTDATYWEDIDDNSDLLFTQDLNSGLKPEMQLGLVMYSEKYFVSLAAHNLLGKNMSFENETNTQNADFKKHLYFMSGYKINVNSKVKITPSVYLKYVPKAPVNLDLNLKVDHQSKYWYGVSNRMKESLNLFAGLNLKGTIDVSYAFEWSYSALKNYNSGSHELILGIRLRHPNITVDPSKYW